MVATPETKTIEDLCKLLNIPERKTAKALFMVGTFINDQTGEEEDKLVVPSKISMPFFSLSQSLYTC